MGINLALRLDLDLDYARPAEEQNELLRHVVGKFVYTSSHPVFRISPEPRAGFSTLGSPGHRRQLHNWHKVSHMQIASLAKYFVYCWSFPLVTLVLSLSRQHFVCFSVHFLDLRCLKVFLAKFFGSRHFFDKLSSVSLCKFGPVKTRSIFFFNKNHDTFYWFTYSVRMLMCDCVVLSVVCSSIHWRLNKYI